MGMKAFALAAVLIGFGVGYIMRDDGGPAAELGMESLSFLNLTPCSFVVIEPKGRPGEREIWTVESVFEDYALARDSEKQLQVIRESDRKRIIAIAVRRGSYVQAACQNPNLKSA